MARYVICYNPYNKMVVVKKGEDKFPDNSDICVGLSTDSIKKWFEEKNGWIGIGKALDEDNNSSRCEIIFNGCEEDFDALRDYFQNKYKSDENTEFVVSPGRILSDEEIEFGLMDEIIDNHDKERNELEQEFEEEERKENEKDDNNSAEEPVEMNKEINSSILQIGKGEKKVFKNTEIHFNGVINCDGEMEIDNCIVFYNEDNSIREITVNKGATLRIKDSKIICRGYDHDYFIKCDSNIATSVDIEKCEFLDCGNFITISGTGRLVMHDCSLRNCVDHFILSMSDSSEFFHNIIIQEDIAQFNRKMPLRAPVIDSYSLISDFYDNTVIEYDSFRNIIQNDCRLRYVKLAGMVRNCSFIGLSVSGITADVIRECKFKKCVGAIFIDYDAMIDNCVFEECTDVIFFSKGNFGETYIRNCQFVSCYNKIIVINRDEGEVIIEFCQFINTKWKKEEKRKEYEFPFEKKYLGKNWQILLLMWNLNVLKRIEQIV